MSTVQISKSQYEKLLDDSAKLNALENGGVDNWEWYDESLTEYHEAKQKAEKRLELVSKLSEYFGEAATIEEHPGGSIHGGIVTFPSIDEEAVLEIIDEFLKES